MVHFRRETRGENESKEKWRKGSPRRRLEWAARTDRQEYRDRIRSLTVIRIPRYNCSRTISLLINKSFPIRRPDRLFFLVAKRLKEG